MRLGKQKIAVFALGLLVAAALVPVVNAAQTSSSHYQVNEVQFGGGSQLHACGTLYCAKQSAGDLTVGNQSSAHYQVQGGFNTDRVPSLTFAVNAVNTNLGKLSPGTTLTATGTFSVKSYLTDGYVVINGSNPPSNGSYTMTGLTTPTASNNTQEQFGINLVANTSPVAFGAAPSQVPSGSFSSGAAATGYNTANLYKYVKGDTIAQSLKSSGETDYTISYLFNASSVTPGGIYSFTHVLVATSTF